MLVRVDLYIAFAAAIAVCTAQSNPCNTAQPRPADQRSSDNKYNPAQTTPRFCDNTLPEGWYRFHVNKVPADMPTTAPRFGDCNTFFPVYLKGSLPTSGPEVERDACVVTPASRCSSVIKVKVKNCGKYNVYHLKPVESCPSAYCFNSAKPCPAGQSSETGLEPGCSGDFPPVATQPTVVPLLGKSHTKVGEEDLRFECRQPKIDITLSFDVVWYVNDVEVKRYVRISSGNMPHEAQLLEGQWMDVGFRMGMNVKCAYRARYLGKGVPSPEKLSQVFFAGIKVVGDTAIQVKAGETTAVQFTLTVPIPCFIGFPCQLRLNVQKIGDCGDGKTHCFVSVNNNESNAVHKFNVYGEFNGLYGNHVAQFVLSATSQSPGKSAWNNATTAPIQVNIHNSDAQLTGSTCHIYNDPHFNTFDKKLFDVHLHGEFVLYRHKTLPYEVRGFFEHCGYESRAHCVCGAAVRSGSQYFVWSKCKDNQNENLKPTTFQTSRINIYGCNTKQLSVTTDNNGIIYKVRVPSGLHVKIDTVGRSIVITPSPADINQTEGLCGNFNGDKNDEFIDPTGKLHSNKCEDFLFADREPEFCMVPTYSKTWRISDSLKSLYNGQMVGQLGQPLTGRCGCDADKNKYTCENTPREACPVGLQPNDVTDQHCTQLSKKRRKRTTSNPGNEDPIPVFPLEPLRPAPPANANNGWTNGWTEAKAEQHCRSVFAASETVKACSVVPNLNTEVMLASCVADIALTGTSDWAPVTLAAYRMQCLNEVSRNASLWRDSVDNGGQPTVLQTILSTSCPGDCSSNGKCIEGECTCNGEWIGPDCSIDGRLAPIVTRLPGNGLCDVSFENCTRAVVQGGVFVRSRSLTCRFQQVIQGSRRLENVFFQRAVYIHPSEVVCELPISPFPGVGYLISVSNRGSNYGKAKLFLPHLECQDCTVKGLQSVCTIQEGFCVVDGACMKLGALSTGRTCESHGVTHFTRWLDKDNPSGSGDFEGLHVFTPRPCSGANPREVRVRLRSNQTFILLTTGQRRKYSPGDTPNLTQFVVAGIDYGFYCRNSDQPAGSRCLDYEVQFACGPQPT